MNDFLSRGMIEKELQDAPYEPALGIRIAQLTTTPVGNQTYILIAIKLDKGKQLIPHLHEADGEILFPLTPGELTLGKALKTDSGEYQKDSTDKILVEWERSQQFIPGKPISILPKVPHHIAAPRNSDCMVLFFLPSTHLNTDRKFVVYPK